MTDKERYLDELQHFLRMPSISTDPAYQPDIACAAVFLRDKLKRAGLRNAGLIEGYGNPLVYAEWLGAPGKPTLLLYGHYDVQPPEPLELWTSPAFEPTVRDGKLYARGSVDDKGQLFLHLKALEAHLKARGKLPVNVIVLAEGEEEVGSANQIGRAHV